MLRGSGPTEAGPACARRLGMTEDTPKSLRLLLVDDFAGADGVGDLREVVHIGSGVAVENDQIRVQAFFHAAFVEGLEVRSRVRSEGSENFVDGKSAAHQLEFG